VLVAAAVGLVLTARPTFFLVVPLIWRMLGWRRGLVAVAVALLTLAPFWPIPAVRFSTNLSAKVTGAGILLLSAVLAWRLERRRDLILAIGVVLLLPAMMVSCNAQHILFGVPFLVAARGMVDD